MQLLYLSNVLFFAGKKYFIRIIDAKLSLKVQANLFYSDFSFVGKGRLPFSSLLLLVAVLTGDIRALMQLIS